MNKQEAARVLAVLAAAFPAHYGRQAEGDVKAVVSLWAELFAQDDYSEVIAAVKSLIAARTNGFPPVIGEVKEALYGLRHRDEPGELEAWAIVSKAVADTDPMNPSKQFDKLPPEIREALGSANALREWGMVGTEQFQTVVASNFQRSYRALRKRRRETFLEGFSAEKDGLREHLEGPAAERDGVREPLEGFSAEKDALRELVAGLCDDVTPE